MISLFVKRLTVIDFSYLDKVRGIVGESLILDVELMGALNDQGMLFDFSMVKKSIKQWIDRYIDHKLVVPMGLSDLQAVHFVDKKGAATENQKSFYFSLVTGETLFHQSPNDAVLFVQGVEFIDCEILKQHLQQKLISILPSNVTNVRLALYPETIEGDYYHYTHGLQQHDGNCQRIAHGHRSSIIIETDGQRNKPLEHHWSECWKDIYLATRSHQTDCERLGYFRFEYQAKQGYFAIELPERCCYFIEVETTVEQIADYLSETISNLEQLNCTVQAFEGVGKGAIAHNKPK